MRPLSVIRGTALVLALFGYVAVAEAAPITYVQTGIASGSIGGQDFSDVVVVVTLTGDTDDVISDPFLPDFPCSFCYANPGLVTVEIPGVGTALVTEPTGIWVVGQPVDLDDNPETPDSPGIVIGTVDDPPLLNSFTGLAATLNFALLDYDLTTAIAINGGIVSGVGYPTDLFVQTSLGNLTFTENIGFDSSGSFTATTSDVPEPATLLLFGSGIVALVARRRFRARG